MNEENKKQREPYNPENTPDPPQRIEPEAAHTQRDKPAGGQGKESGPADKNKKGEKERPHLLDEETRIDDETTI